MRRRRAVLSNQLYDFAPQDDAGRKRVVDAIKNIESQIDALNKPPLNKIPKTDFLISSEKKANMGKAEIKVYAAKLQQKRSRLRKELPNIEGDKKERTEFLLQVLDQELNSL